MKKPKQNVSVSASQAVQYLEDIRTMVSGLDEPTLAISIRIPANVLRAVKLKAKSNGRKYQSMIVDYIRQGLQNKSV